MLGAVISAGRRVLAALVLLAAGWLAVWLTAFRVGHPAYVGDAAKAPPRIHCAVGTQYCDAIRPGWAIPAAVVVACLGVVAAALLYRRRPNWPLHPRTDAL